MKNVNEGSHAVLIDKFVHTLEDASGIETLKQEAEVPSGSGRLDMLLHVTTPEGDHWQLALELLRQGYPRDVRQAIWQLDGYLDTAKDREEVIPMVVADHLSAGAREDLRQRGIGYFDSSGTLFLRHRNWLINIDRPSNPRGPRHTPDLFQGAREMVVHALLYAEQRWLTGLQLADESRTSAYTVSTVLKELDRLEWLESQGSGRTLRRRLAKPGSLLEAWAQAWRERKESKTRWYFYSSSPNSMLPSLTEKLEVAGISDWAFTGTAAANSVSPLLTRVDSAEVMVPPGTTNRYAQAIGLKQADKGANVTLVERSGASMLFRHPYPEYPAYFASPFVLYLDLLDGRGRNAELAEQLRRDILKI